MKQPASPAGGDRGSSQPPKTNSHEQVLQSNQPSEPKRRLLTIPRDEQSPETKLTDLDELFTLADVTDESPGSHQQLPADDILPIEEV